MKTSDVIDYTRQILQPERYRDYCPNGLQVQGKNTTKKIVSGVTASMALLQAAQQAGADMVLVHHGYFWRNEDPCIVGVKHDRIQFLLKHEINLVAYHLPLDAHPEWGNNVQLAKQLGLVHEGWAGAQNIVSHGHLPAPLGIAAFSTQIAHALNRPPQVLIGNQRPVSRVAWCTGGAQSYMETAIQLGVDAFISGEVSEQTYHLAQESGVTYIAAGHHATERYGVQALGQHLAETFGLEHEYIEIPNPV